MLPGLLAGAAFLVFEMLVGLFTTTGWAFPEGIAHTVGIGSDGYTLQPGPLLIGVLVHLSVSVALGALFTAITRPLALTRPALITGAWIFSGVETAVTIWAVLHTLVPARLPLLLDAVPLWASIIGHNIFGLLLGVLVATGPSTATIISDDGPAR